MCVPHGCGSWRCCAHSSGSAGGGSWRGVSNLSMLQLCKDATLPQPPRKTDPLLMMSYAYCDCGGPRYVHTVKHETADPFNLNKASVDRGRFPPLCCLLQFICAANCFCHTRAHTHSYTHATQWCRCSEGKDAPKYFRNRLAAERNMKLMKGTAERQSRKGSSVRWKELGLFDDEW